MKFKINTGSVISDLRILIHQGKQYIPDVTSAEVPGRFRGRPVISDENSGVNLKEAEAVCPTGAISLSPLSIDLGKCVFCGECQRRYPSLFRFTKDYKMASATREGLIVSEGADKPFIIDAGDVRKEIRKVLGQSLKLRQVSAAGDNSCEWELNAAGNANFDMGRFGIEFVASPRHANGIVITGPISENMAGPLQICYDAVPEPKIIVLAGTDAISGGIYNGSPALDRSFIDKYRIDLYIPGNTVHPLTFINGILSFLGRK
jgi:Ni,Fe-hydrogenase III small subunit/ferredoxin